MRLPGYLCDALFLRRGFRCGLFFIRRAVLAHFPLMFTKLKSTHAPGRHFESFNVSRLISNTHAIPPWSEIAGLRLVNALLDTENSASV